ncbi:hypothetical protein Dolphis_95 [Pseudomonas phage Dolphis]|nr:hypothetical protein Dolphis_95 [Pseudomonas phage Dolphis]
MDLGKHQNPNGTYDGVGVMSELTSLPRDEIRAIADQVKANHDKLKACAYHDFEPHPENDSSKTAYQRWLCKHCGGSIGLIEYRWHERGRRPGPVDPNPPKMTVAWYARPEDVHRAMWEQSAIDAGMTYEEMLAESTGVGQTEEGQEVEFTHEQEIAGMYAQGCWAFVDKTNTIHAWAAEDADTALVVHMLAHEIGHATGAGHPDELQEEMRAEQFGRVASLAYVLMQQWAPKPQE